MSHSCKLTGLVLALGCVLSFAMQRASASDFYDATAWQMQAVTAARTEATAREMQEAQSIVNAYAQSHDHFPSNIAEFDDLLKQLVGSGLEQSEIQSSGKYRMARNYAIAVDPSFLSIPEVNGVAKVPDYFCGVPNTIVIHTDGAKNMVCWVAGVDGKPAVLDGKNPAYFSCSLADR